MRYEIYIKKGLHVIEYIFGSDSLEEVGSKAYSIWVQNKAVQLKVVDKVMEKQSDNVNSPFVTIIRYNY